MVHTLLGLCQAVRRSPYGHQLAIETCQQGSWIDDTRHPVCVPNKAGLLITEAHYYSLPVPESVRRAQGFRSAASASTGGKGTTHAPTNFISACSLVLHPIQERLPMFYLLRHILLPTLHHQHSLTFTIQRLRASNVLKLQQDRWAYQR